jgi:hypothetical protein
MTESGGVRKRNNKIIKKINKKNNKMKNKEDK